MRYLLVLCLLFFSFRSHAQHVLHLVDSLLLDNQSTQAITLLEESIRTTTDKSLRQALTLKKCEALINAQEYTEAQNILESASQSGISKTLQIQYTITKGSLSLYLGRNEDAEENLSQALVLLEEQQQSNSLEAAKALSMLGLVYYNAGKIRQAEEQLLMALQIRLKLLTENHELIAASYNDLGLVYSRHDPDKALTYYEKALPIYQALHGQEHAKIAINYANTGVLYQNLELFGDAINNLETALSIWNKIPQTSARKAFVLYQLGYTYQLMKNNGAAEAFFKKSLQEYTLSYGEKHPDIANVLNVLGNLKKSSDAYDTALVLFQQGLQANLKNFTPTSVSHIPALIDYYNGNYLLYSLMYKAQTLEAKHFGKTLRFTDLSLALDHLTACDALIDKLRQQITHEADKISLGVVANEVYADGVRIATHMSEVALSNRKSYRAKAFYFAEKSKSAVLLDAISDVKAKAFAGIPAELLDEEQHLKNSIALCTQKLSQKPSQEEETKLRETLFILNRQYQNFISKLEERYPEYFNLKFNTTTPSPADLQKVIDDKTALLSYFIDDSKPSQESMLYIFCIRKKKLHITTHGLAKDFNKQLTGFRNSIYYSDQKTLNEVGYRLGKLLLPSLKKSTTNLVIFPTGRLGIIPFESLLTKRAKEEVRVPYLLRKYAIRYEFSASLALQKKAVERLTSPSIFLCAPVTFAEIDNLTNLPGTEQEVKAIGGLFENQVASQKIVTHAEASEGMVKSGELKNYNFLHFATHGIVDEVNPELSRIFLHKSAAQEDGYLFSGEIYNLQLNASLVTLSACQTGLGKISKGEGVIGLSRALIYAGAKNIIVSYWSVADQSTAELMTNFYKELVNNRSALSSALQKVKLDMLNGKAYAAPYYWAPFVLIGF